jgi:hypothetical protein
MRTDASRYNADAKYSGAGNAPSWWKCPPRITGPDGSPVTTSWFPVKT